MAETDVAEVLVKFRADLSEVQAGMKKMETEFQSGFSRIQGAAATFATALNRLLGVAISLEGIRRFTLGVIETTSVLQRASLAFLTVAGDAKIAANELAFVREAAKDLGLNVEVAIKQYAKLSAASKGTALQGEETRRAFKAVGAASLVLGLNTDQTQRVFIALEQMMSKGVVATEELRRQMGDNLPGAFSLAAKAMGVTQAELDKMLKKGLVESPDFVRKFTRVLEEDFGHRLPEAAKTLQVQINKLNTAWFEFKESVANTGFITAVTFVIENMSKGLDTLVRLMERAAVLFGNPNIARQLKDEIKNTDEAIIALQKDAKALQATADAAAERGGKAPPSVTERLRRNVEEQNKLQAQLRELSKAQTVQSGVAAGLTPEGPKGTPPGADDEKGLKRLAIAIDTFRDKLRDEISGLEKNRAELELNSDAANKVARAYEAIQAVGDIKKRQQIVPPEMLASAKEAEQTLIDMGFAVDQINEKSLTKLQEALNRTSARFTRAKFDAEAVKKTLKDLEDIEQVEIDIPVVIKAEDALRLKKQLEDLAEQARLATVDIGAPGGAEKQRINELMLDFIKQAKIIQASALALGEDMEQAGRRIDEFFVGVLAKITRGDTLVVLKDQLAEIDEQARVFGASFDKLDATISAVSAALQDMIKKGRASGPDFDELLKKFQGLEAARDLRDSFHNITESIETGIRDTMRGIAEGTQTLSEGMRNMLRNVLLSINEAIINSFVIAPLKGVINAFFDGFTEAFVQAGDNAAKNIARELGKSLGTAMKDAMKSVSSGGFWKFLFGSESGVAGAGADVGGMHLFDELLLAGGKEGGSVPHGLKLMRFDEGGAIPAILHQGEFVLRKSAVEGIGLDTLIRANRDLRLPRMQWGGYVSSPTVPSYQNGGMVNGHAWPSAGQGNAPNVKVTINGDIIPREPTMRKEDVIQIGLQQFENRGLWQQSLEQRMSPRK